ncbi:deoxyguanosinetriphosphate triphosphohydrolase [Mucilaginibacter daejeonensis]|uniref:deoxyguanosinetriphosphate triphosphohydrolase n=1 Tax=Mucilaginibacter daejeonensis TaxID=398049 RepID=UPI001D173B4E|nr:deoxyguanosinetriphosphate triphosphohydrolase [Mucilaginibacter daejeonensis]UEG53343.1 deoxyguanosinetriphosphate triphosphohydrolase [Mucilaginibacter daejeonensis]
MQADEMTWCNCFSARRYGMIENEKGIRTEYERDWDRIIFSSPFRRLQNKTQVFPLPEEVFVHNRLTHSLEVASVGRSLGKIIGKHLSTLPDVERNSEAKRFYKNNLKNVIAAACLAHDLGNPAFGHSGEEAISKYFKKRDTDSIEDKKFKGRFTPAEWNDLKNFEGNANAIRILTQQQKGRVKGGFRLTYSTLGAIIKYPCESLASERGRKHRKKYGYFKADEKVFLDIATVLKMIPDNSTKEISYKRHPFVYLVEAADDICYNIIDLEDSHRLGILSYEEVSTLLLAIVAKNKAENINAVKEQVEELKSDKNEALAYLRAKSINTLALRCSEIFIENKDAIITGDYENTLIEDIPELNNELKAINDLSVKKIYNYKEVVKLELAGFRIMSGLVEDFVTAALTPEKLRQKEHKKVLELLPSQFKFEESDTDYVKVLHMIDLISGMTDLFALKLYRNLRGIEI